ncbi:MAG: DEAD/DEAH box helicase, partial [Pseudomonadota bacterium]
EDRPRRDEPRDPLRDTARDAPRDATRDAPRRDDRRDDRRDRNDRRDGQVVGMGDHVPDFILRSFRLAAPTPDEPEEEVANGTEG